MVRLRTTHTYVTMDVSKATYDEIRAKLKAAEYDHCLLKEDEDELLVLEGVGLKCED